jgi:hypothetical protein
MFGRKPFQKKVEVEENTINALIVAGLERMKEAEKVKPPMLRPLPMLVPSQPCLDEYEQMAKEIRFMPAKLIEAKIFQILRQNEIKVFDYDQVYLYLKDKALRENPNKRWIWRPLREQDRLPFEFEHPKSSRVDDWGWHGYYRPKQSEFRPYDKPVPLRVLKEVKLIGDQVPTATFFVSDYATVRPDPFIMVTQLDVAIIVFDVWDEPDFGI